MLKLKKLQILGFKSFCDRTELKFQGEGIAAIVGPNGCGKSNISDAISWVLGEQSAKSLRGSRMEDVIFIGTRDRKPTGMAEVSLTLIDPDVYEGAAALSTETEIEIQDDYDGDDWDEAALRAASEEDTLKAMAEVQPLGKQDVPERETVASNGTVADGEQSANPVVLKIRRRKLKPALIRAGEIMVTRRLFRTGESEYLLNGKLCRLRDIQDIFMGTGLGPESYAIIEQGRIGQILSSKPTDRRAIIEEAAGVTKFKTRKRLAELRLEAAQQNLARINDIFEEVTRQMNSLKRQASKAERYARLRDEMREKLRIVLAGKFLQMEREQSALAAGLNAVGDDIQRMGGEAQALEESHAEGTSRGFAITEEIRANQEQRNAFALESDRSASRRKQNEERCAELEARSAAARAELARTEEQHASLQGELASNRSIVEKAAGEAGAARKEAETRSAEAAAAVNALTANESGQERCRMQILEAVSASSAARNQMNKVEERLAALDREAERLEQESAGARAEIEGFDNRRGQLSLEHDKVSRSAAELNAQLDDTRRGREEKRKAEAECKLHLDSLRAEYATALGKKNSLEALIAEHGYTTESVKRLFQSGKKGFAPVGVLADFLEVEDPYERVVEEFLRDELNYVVVKSWDAADTGLQMLRGDVDGRATFLVHPDDAQAKFSFVAGDTDFERSRRKRDAIVPVKSCIRVLNGFGKSLEAVLPKLANGYITPDAASARELALENRDAYFLAPTGECFHNVTLTGGRERNEGPLSLKRDLRDLLKLMDELEKTLHSEEKRAGQLAKEIATLTARLERLEEEQREAERRALTSGHALEQLSSELKRVRERLMASQHELGRVRQERGESRVTLAEYQTAYETAEKHRRELEHALAGFQEKLNRLRLERDTASQAAAAASSRVAALEERRIAAAASLERIESLAGEVNARVLALRGQLESAAAESLQRTNENQTLAQQLVTLAAQQEAAANQAAALAAESEEVRGRITEIDAALRELRTKLDTARDRKGELSAQSAKLMSDAEHLRETCLNELGAPPLELLANAALPRVEGEALAQEDALYRELRGRLDAMGPVNMMALEEYNEISARHSFLEAQRKDLLESIENTQNTIREIDTLSRQKFEEAFGRINENFQMTFRKLFGGGQAFMRLTEIEGEGESGIDVIASPPGKKLQNVLLLSGGEKALTALALLVGIFQFQPSPFCILDEVDAPLDEANIGRFTNMIREMSAKTQFVLITHSKKTMSISPVMYGVTMQEPGISKLVSVKFEEATA